MSASKPNQVRNIEVSAEGAEILKVQATIGDQEINKDTARELGLPRLNFRPLLLRTTVLVTYFILNVVWIILLALALFKRRPFHGSFFIFDGYGAGYVATAAKFLSAQQAMGLGQIMPYCGMNSSQPKDRVGKRTIGADYYPYDWPITRLRLALNGHRFFFLVDLATLISSFAVIQFASNILGEVYDDNGFLQGWLPNKDIIYIVLGCHTTFALITLSTLLWLRERDTGVVAEPGSIAMLLGMLQGSDLSDDFYGLDKEPHRWVFRERLDDNEYRIGYWERPGHGHVYGIRRTKKGIERMNDFQVEQTPLIETEPGLPHFYFIPWFLRPFYITIWVALLVAALSIALTLLIHDDILDYGFAPHASTIPSPVLRTSSAAFLWSFFLSFAADQYRLLFRSIDIFYRLVQPYADLRHAKFPPSSLTLDYTNSLPVIVTIKALRNKHWKVAFSSLVSLASSFMPALAANIFSPGVDADNVPRVYANKTPFFIVLAFTVLLIVATLVLVPDRSRYLPHDIEPLSDHISFLYQSSLLKRKEFLLDVPGAPPAPKPEKLKLKKRKIWWNRLKRIPEIKWKDATHKLATLKNMNPFLEHAHEEKVKKELIKDEPANRIAFGVWQRDDGSFAVGIDTANKMISLYGKQDTRVYIWKRIREFFF